jgi:hypothetical protein
MFVCFLGGGGGVLLYIIYIIRGKLQDIKHTRYVALKLK